MRTFATWASVAVLLLCSCTNMERPSMNKPTFTQDLTRDAQGFQSGLSDISVGRFAGFRDELPTNAGFLTGDTADSGLSAVFNGKKVSLLPPPQYTITRSHTWTATSTVLEFQRDGRQTMALHASLLAPGVLFQFSEKSFALRLQSGLQAEHTAFATKAGIKINSSTEHYDGHGHIYDRATDGDITEPWMLIWWQSCDQPLVLFLENHPQRMYGLATDGIIKGEYNQSVGNLTLMPLWGIRKYKNKECADWKKNGVPADVLAEIRTWASRLQDYPIGCHECFRIDRTAGTVEIRDTFEYLSNHSYWNIPHEPIAAISPVIAHAFKHGYSKSLDGKIIYTNAMTGYGPFPFVAGTSYAYTIPYARCIDHQVAPLRLENAPAYDPYIAALDRYIQDPKFTYGGDYDYDKNSPLDSLHDLRLLAWSTWSLDEPRRIARFKDLQKAVLNITPANYHHETEPFTGAQYWWDKQLFDQDGIVQFDFEWYNGLNMAAPFAYWQFGHGITTNADLAKFYPYLQNWGRYMDIRHDWVFLAPPVTIPGRDYNTDGVMHAISGIIGYARVAHLLGDQPMADRQAYHASKMLISWYDAWHAEEYATELQDWGLLDKPIDPKTQAAVMMFHGNGVGQGGVGFWANTYGDNEPEILDFARTFYYDRIKDVEYNRWEAWAAKDSPYWPTKPIVHGNERSVMWGINAERAVHHYSLDPHFTARALLFHETLDQQKKYAIEHSGNVIECFIVGAHPMVLFPTTVRFGGNVWDEKQHKLTTTLLRAADATATVLIESKTAPTKITGGKSWKYTPEHDAGRATIEVDFAGKDKIVLESWY